MESNRIKEITGRDREREIGMEKNGGRQNMWEMERMRERQERARVRKSEKESVRENK